jgi:hypothetical protein
MRKQDDPLDSAIDAVAREMTAGDASANLRARVLADIDSPSRFVWWRPAFAAVAAAVVVAVALRSTFRETPSTVESQSSTLRNLPSPLRNPPLSTVGNPPSTLPNRTSTLRVSSSTLRRSPSTVVNPYVEPPLKEESIAVNPIAVTPMAPNESIAVEELPSITPIAVAPLGPGEQR